MLLKNLLLVAAIFAGLFLAPPEALAGKRRNENKKYQRALRKDERRQADDTRKPQLRDPRRVLAELKACVRNSGKVDESCKYILIECLEQLARTERGKWILEHTPEGKLAFEVDPSQATQGVYKRSGKSSRIGFKPRLFGAVSNAGNMVSRRLALINLTGTLSHELTHHCQHGLSMCVIREASTTDCTIQFKLRELHARLEAEHVKDQMQDLPDFRYTRNHSRKSFFTKLKEAKLKTGASPREAERFARTEFVRVFWRNQVRRPVVVGNVRIWGERQIYWNNAYNRHSLIRVLTRNRVDYYRETGVPIRDELKRAAEMIGVDLTPEFFMNEKAFRYEHGRLLGFMDGVRCQESDYLTVGDIHKQYANDRLERIYWNIKYPMDGDHTDYWYGTRRVRATYTIENRKFFGVYREFDYDGKLVAVIPFEHGAPNGIGWVLENGRKCRKVFRNGRCFDEKKPTSAPRRRVR